MRSLLGLVVAVVVASVGARAYAQASTALAEADAAYAAGELDRALARFDGALREGGHSSAELARIHLHLGILRASFGDRDAARRAFAYALAVDSTLAAPRALGPELRTVFDDARAERAAQRLALEVRPAGRLVRGEDLTLRLAASGAPAGLVGALRVRVARGDAAPAFVERVEGSGPANVALSGAAWSAGDAVEVVVDVLDEYGNTIASEPRSLSPSGPIANPTPPPERAQRSRGWLSSPWFWIAAGVVVAGTTAGVLYLTAEERYVIGEPRIE